MPNLPITPTTSTTYINSAKSNEAETPRMQTTATTDANTGRVGWSPKKSLWYLCHTLISLFAIIATIRGDLAFSWSALAVFIIFTATTLCLGHSLGMHRRLIHNSYDCPLWLEYMFVHLGVLVGMAGPLGMMQQHDLRDWAQRQPNCHPYLRHGNSFLSDGWQQLNYDLLLTNPPIFAPETRVRNDKIYQFMQRTWMWQQLPWALLLFYFGGISWVIWGISARIFVSVTGHWLVGYFAHNTGDRDWHIHNAATQGYNIKFAGLISMGESWHNNHHAYPNSALLGLYQGQTDLGFWVLNALHNLGLVWNIKLPQHLPHRPERQLLHPSSSDKRVMKTLRPCKYINKPKPTNLNA
ncbi:acyl-CoA desaturase [Psychrobacter sp. I-STPA10]|uniref:acyl-CoA desaturase n=1 Tax=Psychrobacter sp. I-STPA10 TaxID=2585769 RepID=UPI001E60C0BF|nr:acyl-CoA desaturase [Psychrobacter sp. I-STPA10]